MNGDLCFNTETSQVIPFGYEEAMAKRAFGSALKAAIQAKGLSVNAWAEEVLGGTHGQVFNVIAGRRTPPLDEVERWATKLGLEGKDRQTFLDLAALTHLPVDVEARFLRILKEHDKLLLDYQTLAKRAASSRRQLKP